MLMVPSLGKPRIAVGGGVYRTKMEILLRLSLPIVVCPLLVSMGCTYVQERLSSSSYGAGI